MLIGWPIGVSKQFLGALALPSGETASPYITVAPASFAGATV